MNKKKRIIDKNFFRFNIIHLIISTIVLTATALFLNHSAKGSNNSVIFFLIVLIIIISSSILYGNKIRVERLRLKQISDTLNKKEEMLITIFNQSPVGIAVGDNNSRIIDANPKYEQLVGRSKKELLECSWGDLTYADDLQLDFDNMNLLHEGEIDSYSMNTRYIRPDGSIIWLNMTVAPLILDNTHDYYIRVIEDISDQKAREKQILYLTYHDALTGVYNRRYFEEEKNRLEDESFIPLSIIMGDINGLKLINDVLGHSEGDKLIKVIAQILVNCCDNGETIARIGGDEFAILMPNTTSDEAYKKMKQIEKACLEYESKHKDGPYHTSISLGCATRNSRDELFSDIIRIAEDYMYRDKLLQSRSLRSAIISSMKATLFEKSQETEEHAQRLIKLTRAIGKEMKLKDEQLKDLELLSTLHDIGELGIADTILNKPGKLTDEEWLEIKKHTSIGYRIAMSSIELAPIAEYILYHHERWDGKGYPAGLKEEEIPLLSRILAVVDSYDAMTENRSYRNAISKEAAIEEIRKNLGTQFDSNIACILIEKILYNYI